MLLQKDPRARLGAGPPGTSLDYSNLKAHAFFSGINFTTLEQTSPPIPADRFVRFLEELKAKKETRSSESAIFNDFINKKGGFAAINNSQAEMGVMSGAQNPQQNIKDGINLL